LTAVRVDAQSHPGPLGVLGALAHGLLQSAPAEALETLPGQLSVLGQAFPELLALRPANTPLHPQAELSRDPTERRTRIQSSLCAWVLEVAGRRPLLVIVDDVQAADAASRSALTVLCRAAQTARLLVCVTRRIDAGADSSAQQLERFGARLKLRGLPRVELEKLVSAVFGETPHRARLLPWLISVAAGNPGRSLELLRGLVERGVIRYESGAWVLPAQLPEHALPKSLGDAMSSRIAQLSASAVQLLQHGLRSSSNRSISYSLAGSSQDPRPVICSRKTRRARSFSKPSQRNTCETCIARSAARCRSRTLKSSNA
jgi:predicted ATPase